MTNSIRTLLVDDHAVVRQGLATFLLLHDDIEIVGEASDGEEALAACTNLHPDVVLMDLIMPKMDGATATEKVRAAYPQIQIIALTSFEETDLIQRVLQAGAIGYLLKNVSGDALAEAIRSAHAGRPTLAPEATQALIQASIQPKEDPIGHDLTPREQDVLALMVEGFTNKEIAAQLVIGNATVKFHVSNILSKLYVTTRTEAVSVALKHNLIETD